MSDKTQCLEKVELVRYQCLPQQNKGLLNQKVQAAHKLESFISAALISTVYVSIGKFPKTHVCWASRTPPFMFQEFCISQNWRAVRFLNHEATAGVILADPALGDQPGDIPLLRGNILDTDPVTNSKIIRSRSSFSGSQTDLSRLPSFFTRTTSLEQRH